jgi:TolA protein
MKGSIATSAVLHGLALAFALVSVGSPAPLEVAPVESVPVEIISEVSQIQQGDLKAAMAEKSAPKPSEKPQTLPTAENAGDNDLDLKSPPKPSTKPVENEASAAPPKTEKAEPSPDPVKEEVKPAEKPPAEPATEVAALPTPKEEVKPDPKPDPKPEPEAKAEPTPEPTPTPAEETPAESPDAAALPERVPAPTAKPKVEQAAAAQTAKTPDRKTEAAPKAQKKTSSEKESDFNADEVAALLNKTESSGGGAKRSQDKAALGGKKATTGNTLSMSEMDALKGMIQKNWSIVPGMADAEGMVITVTIQLDPNGEIIGMPDVKATGGSASAQRAMIGSAVRAVRRSAPFKLPAEKYDSWGEIVINFDPRDMVM